MASATTTGGRSASTHHTNSDGKSNITTSASHRASNASAPRALATPTDLTPDEVRQVAETVNALVADHFALYVKTKNFHWHLASSHFRDYHLMFDEQADSIFEAIDPMAERVRKIGGTTIRSIGHIAQISGIEDDNEDFVPAPEMIRRLLDDNKASARKLREAIEITEKARDTPTSNLLQEILDQCERRIWFLFEVSTGGDNEN